jgi:hypothetical protein
LAASPPASGTRSADFYLEAYGLLTSIILSDPVQVATTLQSIFGWPTRVLIRRVFRERHRAKQLHDLREEFEFQDRDFRIAGRLAEGSRLEFRYRGPDGTELETSFEA